MNYGGPGAPTPQRPLADPRPQERLPIKVPLPNLRPETRTAIVVCDGRVSNGRCTSCFQYVQSTIAAHFTEVVELVGLESRFVEEKG